jgi:hypothetical protein
LDREYNILQSKKEGCSMKDYYLKVLAVAGVIAVFLIFAYCISENSRTCFETNCNNHPVSDSIYCSIHKQRKYYSSSSYSGNKSTSSSSSSRNKNSSSSSASRNKSSYSSSSSGSTKKKSKYSDPYSDGYDDIYLDDDYDSKRYSSDREYANGVDDAMEDLDWE